MPIAKQPADTSATEPAGGGYGIVPMAFQLAPAFALGADAVMFGRPYLYALAAACEPAVDHLLNQFT